MSGYRANVGYGVLKRGEEGPAELPFKVVEGAVTTTRLPIFLANSNTNTPTDCIHQLTNRFGVGVDISINRGRGMNYRQELGLREFSVATSGMYEVDFTINGAFVTNCVDWIQYGMMSDEIRIDKGSKFTNPEGVVIATPADEKVGYVTNTVGNEPVTSKSPIGYSEYAGYKNTIDDSEMVIVVNYYVNLDGPKYFDIAYQQVNENTTSGKGNGNELGVLCGCVIDSFSISYESGGDAAVKFSISGNAMSEWIQQTGEAFDFNVMLSKISDSVLIAGCLSADKKGTGTYTEIAQTDSASISVSNNTSKLGNCLKLYYSSVALGAQTVEMSTSTYANNPNKYMNHMYGHDTLAKAESGSLEPKMYSVAKQPVPIKSMKLESNDSNALDSTVKNFITAYLTDVYVGSSNRSYSVDNAIMDEPDLRPRKIKIVVGHTPTPSE